MMNKIFGLWNEKEGVWIESNGELIANENPRVLLAYRFNARQFDAWEVREIGENGQPVPLKLSDDGLPLPVVAPLVEEEFDRRGLHAAPTVSNRKPDPVPLSR